MSLSAIKCMVSPCRKEYEMTQYPSVQTLRRTLHKLGFKLIKSRARHWSEENQCGYKIVMIGVEGVVWGRNFDLSIEDVYDHIKIFS